MQGYIDMLRLRANLLRKIRRFFEKRDTLEVETPILGHSPSLEQHIEPFVSDYRDIESPLYLQSSPEYAMKRLLAMGSGSIYQITKAFRKDEAGRLHNPEFSMIEWYRVGADLENLMKEVEEFVSSILGFDRVDKISYSEAFRKYAGFDPLIDSVDSIREAAIRLNLSPPASLGNCRESWLSFLLAEVVEPKLGVEVPTIMCHYPASQAALAKISESHPSVSERFELYINGIELCNGYHELTDYDEHIKRFKRENRLRVKSGKAELPADKNFLGAIKAGLPECSGVSFGFDRMVMIAAGADSIDKVIPFAIDKA